MRKTNYFKLFALAIICCMSTSIFADTSITQVSDSLSFANALADLQSPTGSTGGTGGVIQLNAPLVLRPWKQTYLLSSTPTAPIEINTQQYSITVSGTSTTGDSTILQIGNNLNIHGTSTVLTNLNRGIIRISGSQISSTTITAGTTTVAGVAGWVFMSGGTVSINATGVTNAYALGVLNNFALVLRGGTISAVGDNTRALSLTDNVTPTPISGTTITANGNGAYAIQSLGANSLTIGDNMTITTTSTALTDAALVGGGATSRIVIPSTASNVAITSSIPYKLDNAAAAVIDLRGTITITATPVSGSTLATPGNIVLTASGNASMATAGIYYSYDTNPTISSSNIASGGNVMAASATTTIKASIGKNGFIDGNVFTFVYTVTNPSTTQYISTAAGLLSAYNASQLTPSGTTTQMELTASFPIASTDLVSGAFTIKPDANHPIVLNCKGFTITIGSTNFLTSNIIEFGGNLTMTGTASTGLFIINCNAQIKISGGSYTLNANSSIFQTGSGGNSKVGGQLIMSDSYFEVAGSASLSARILYFNSGDYLNISATNCNFKVSAVGQAFYLKGGQNVSFNNCTLNNLGTATPFNQAPSNAAQTLTINGFGLTMSSGAVFSWAGSKIINTVIKDLTVTGSAITTNPTVVTAGSKFYDFRAFTPTASPASGQFRTDPNVTLTLATTAVLPVDATGATMVYTLDGTNPISTSSVYSLPISFTGGTIKASALKDGFLGKIYTFSYSPVNEPATSAPTPTTPVAKVVSLFSDAYQTADPGTNFNPWWNQSTVVSTIKVGSTDNVLKYTNFNYQGTEFAQHLNVADMKYMHVDVFTSNLSQFKIGPISPNPTTEIDATLNPTANTWNSYDIQVSTFTGVNMSDIFQMGTSGGDGTQTVYLDNIYFWTDAIDTDAPTAFTASAGAIAADAVTLLLNGTDNSGAVFYDITYGSTTVTTSGASGVQKSFIIGGLTGTTNYSFSIVARDRSGNAVATPIVVTAVTLTPIPGAPVPIVNASQVISIFSDTYTNLDGTDFNPNWGQVTQESLVQLNGNNTIKYANLSYQGIALATFVNASTMNKLHVDIYPLDETSLQITPISPATPNNMEFSVALTPLILNQWNSYNLSLTEFTGVDMTNVIQFKFTGSGGKSVYMDNLYFFNDLGTGFANVTADNLFKCYPSQVIDRLTVKADTEISQVTVRNLLGQLVKFEVVNSNEQSIDLSAVSTGNYFVTVKLVNGQLATQKIVKL